MESKLTEEFKQSWDDIEAFYSKYDDSDGKVLSWVQQMRAKGYDSIFRAGQSLYSLMLSRSAHYGLREQQPFIIFDFNPIISQTNRRLGLNKILEIAKGSPDEQQVKDDVERLLSEINQYLLNTSFVQVTLNINGQKEIFDNKIGDFSPLLIDSLLKLEKEPITQGFIPRE